MTKWDLQEPPMSREPEREHQRAREFLRSRNQFEQVDLALRTFADQRRVYLLNHSALKKAAEANRTPGGQP